MRSFWKIFAALALMLPLGAFVAGTLVASAADGTEDRDTLIIEENPTPVPVADPEDDTPGIDVVTPSPTGVGDDHGGDRDDSSDDSDDDRGSDDDSGSSGSSGSGGDDRDDRDDRSGSGSGSGGSGNSGSGSSDDDDDDRGSGSDDDGPDDDAADDD